MPGRSTMVPRRSSMVAGILRRKFCRKHKVNPKIENMSKIINVVQNYNKNQFARAILKILRKHGKILCGRVPVTFRNSAPILALEW